MANKNYQIKKEAETLFRSEPEIFSQDPIRDMQEELKSVNLADIAKDVKTVYDMLSQVNERIGEEKKDYKLNNPDSEQMENLYGFKMDILYNLAYGFHPFSSYGKQCIKKAISSRKKYEALGKNMFTRIGAKNISVFMPVLSEDLAEDIRTGRRKAIGAIRSIGQGTYGAGAIVYWLDTQDSEEPLLRIEWLYVHENFRGKRIADSLIGELVYQMQKNDIEAMTASFVVGSTWEPVLAGIFAHWRFGFGPQMEPDTIIRLGDVSDFDALRKKASSASPLSAMEERMRTQFVERVLRDGKYKGYIWNIVKDTDYFDPDLSCFIGEWHSPEAVLLVHKAPSGNFRVEYADADDDDTDAILAMASFAIYQALAKVSDEDILIDFPIRMDELEIYLDKAIPTQQSALLVTGALCGIPDEYDINEKMINNILSMTDEEIKKAAEEYEKMIREEV